jgi:hypothetical protein
MGTYVGNHALLSFGGTLRGTDEQWSCGLRFGGTISAETVTQGECATLAGVLSTWVNASTTIGQQAHLSWVKYNRLNNLGKYIEAQTNVIYYEPAAEPRAVTVSTHPNQIALVASLETGFKRGLAHIGRIYLPIPTASVGNDGRISTTAQDSAAADVKTLIDALNNALPMNTIMIMSKVREGETRVVTGVSVGRVLDTMRSRRTSLKESRVLVPLAGV